LEGEGVGADAAARQNLEARLQAAMSDWVERHPRRMAPEPAPAGAPAPSYSRAACEARARGLVARPEAGSVAAVRRAAGRGMTELKHQHRGREAEVHRAVSMARPATHIPADAAARAALQHAARNDRKTARLEDELQDTVRRLAFQVESAAQDRRAQVLEVSRRELASEPMPCASADAAAQQRETANRLRYTAQQMQLRLDHDAQRRQRSLEHLHLDLGHVEMRAAGAAPPEGGDPPPPADTLRRDGSNIANEAPDWPGSAPGTLARPSRTGFSAARYQDWGPPSPPRLPPEGPGPRGGGQGEGEGAGEPLKWQPTVHSIRKARNVRAGASAPAPPATRTAGSPGELLPRQEGRRPARARPPSRASPVQVPESPRPATFSQRSPPARPPPSLDGPPQTFEKWKARRAAGGGSDPAFVVGSPEVWANLNRAQKGLDRVQFQLDSHYTRYQNEVLSSSGRACVYSENADKNARLWDPSKPGAAPGADEAEEALSARMWALSEGTRRLALRRPGLGSVPSTGTPKVDRSNIRTAGLLIQPSPPLFVREGCK